MSFVDSVRRIPPPVLLRGSIAVALLTIALKTVAWWITGSVGLLSDAMESLVNLASAIFALVMVSIAARPADEDHGGRFSRHQRFAARFNGSVDSLSVSFYSSYGLSAEDSHA